MIISARFHTTSHNQGGYDPKDRWSADSYHTTWHFEGFSQGDKFSHYNCEVPDFDPEKSLYAVYVIYSTGDSFSSNQDGCLELIHITHDGELAIKIRDFIKEDYVNHRDKEKASGENPFKKQANVDGVEFWTYPWKGYFESLSGAYVSLDYCRNSSTD